MIRNDTPGSRVRGLGDRLWRAGAYDVAMLVRPSPGYLWTLWDLIWATGIATIAWQYRGESPVHLVIGWSMAVLLLWRRRRPVTVLLGIAFLAFVQVLAEPATAINGTPARAYDIAVLIAVVSTVAHAPHRWQWYLAGAVALAGNGMITVDTAMRQIEDPNGTLVGADQLVALLLCAAVWLSAYVLRINKGAVVIQAERAAAAERERDHLARIAAIEGRAAIARELHDVVAHGLAVMIVQADGAIFTFDKKPDRAREALNVIAGTGRAALEEMHSIVAVLRGTRSAAEPDDDHRRPGLAQLDTLADRAREAGMTVDLKVDGDHGGLSPIEELTLYRITQEGLTNALHHAGPHATVTIRLRIEQSTASLDIADDGGRPEQARPGTGRPSGGNGLVGMRERVAVHGGTFSAGPGGEGGWQISAVIPVRTVA
jgi:signal transduction histidine kinase